MYVECKSSHPDQVSDRELREFLQRTEELAPDLSVLLVDTDNDLGGLVEKLNDIFYSISEHDRSKLSPMINAQLEYSVIDGGYVRVFVTNSRPSILRQLRRC